MEVGEQTISYGNAAGRVVLRVEHEVVWLKLEQDPHGQEVVDCLQDAVARGWLKAKMPFLIDMLAFNGNIDWGAVRAIRTIVPCAGVPVAGFPGADETQKGLVAGNPGTQITTGCRVAYVTRDPMFAPVLRIIRDLFTQSRHRQFRDLEPALLWVCQPEPEFRGEDDEE